MNKLNFLLVIIFIFISCVNNSTKENNNMINGQSIENDTYNLIKGIWKLKNESNATFKIMDDSIYYIDENQYFKYELKADSIYIFYDGFVHESKYKVNQNELIFNSELSKDTFERK